MSTCKLSAIFGAVVLGSDQGVEQILESGVLVCELVASQAGLVGKGFDGELPVGVQRDADEQPDHCLDDCLDFGGVLTPARIGGPARAGQRIADGRGDVGRLAALLR